MSLLTLSLDLNKENKKEDKKEKESGLKKKVSI